MKLRSAGVLALGAALAVSMNVLPASARPAKSPGTSVAGPAGPSPTLAGQAAVLGRARQLASEPRRTAALTGTVRGAAGLPLAGACVTALGAAGAGAVQPASTRASDDGRFLLTGLRAGRYTLRFTDCAQPGRYLPGWSGPTGLAATARPVQIGGGKVTRLAPVTLRAARPSTAFARPSAAQLARAAGQPGAAAIRLGGISGRITGVRGRPVTGTCVEINFGDGYLGLPVSRQGGYSTGLGLPPGRYKVEFAAVSCGANPGNWAPQWYKDTVAAATATPVRVLAGKVTGHIDARLVHGGIVTGTVTNRAGSKLTGACVVLLGARGGFVAQATTRHGGYSFRGLPAARYRVLFTGSCSGQGNYLPQWWRDAPTMARARPVPVRLGTTTSGIDARLATGGTITGTVRFASRTGRVLGGICVDAQTGGDLTGSDYFAATNDRGRYQITGLPTGSYSVFFNPGCNNNGNYLSASYPRPVHVTAGRSVRGIDAVLGPGATISGTVTNGAGQPIASLAVSAGDAVNGNGGCTGKDGTFRVTQLPPGRYTVEFGSFCGGPGNYAPQFYPGQSDPGAAVPVAVARGQHVAGIDAKMAPGATITGTVTSAAGHPVPSVCVGAVSPGDSADSAEFGLADEGVRTGPAGRYRIPDLAAGRYEVQFTACGPATVANRFFGGRAGAPAGDIVSVGTGATVSGISTVLAPGGAISGDVRSAAGRQAPGTCEDITSLRTGRSVSDQLGAFGSSGAYRVTGLAAGRYTVEFNGCATNDVTQWFNHKSTAAAATAVRVTAGHTTAAVGASLARGGRITGHLSSRMTGKPVRNFCVLAVAGDFFGIGITGPHGNYVVDGLNTARYHLEFSNCDGSGAAVADARDAATVPVTSGRTVSGIDAALPAGGTISGMVTAPSGRGDVCVAADPVSAGGQPGSAPTSHTGHYVIANLPAGQYRVRFETRGDCDNSPGGLVPQWYKAAATSTAATAVTVRGGRDTAGIDATLTADGGLSGQVTAAAGGAPLAGVCVRAVPLQAGRAASFTASADGSYAMTGLIPGTYTVEFSSGCGATGYARQWWRGASSAAKATVVIIRPGTVTTDIGAALTR